jgi:hypothetical protein
MQGTETSKASAAQKLVQWNMRAENSGRAIARFRAIGAYPILDVWDLSKRRRNVRQIDDL